MNYLSVCSGIEAFTVAMHGTGAKAVAFCEFDKFPSAVLAHHWPEVPNLGDMTKWREWDESMLLETDTLVGGTPCQAFSIAGLRNSLADERGNLTLTYVHILDQIDKTRALHGRPPAVCIWENVPGVLNTDDNAFGCFLAALAGEDDPLQPPGGRWSNAGYVRGPRRAIAWRSFDAQYFGLAQRRQRVFVVASAREGFRPEEVLFEWEGVRRDSPPSRGAGETITPTIRAGAPNGGAGHGARSGDSKDELIVPVCMATGQAGAEIGIGTTLNCNHEAPIITQEVSHALTANGFDASEDGTGRGTPIIPTIADPISTRPYQDRGSDDNNLICVHGTQEVWRQTCGCGHEFTGKLTDPCQACGKIRDGETHGNPVAFMADDYQAGTYEACDTSRPVTTSADRTRAAPIVAFSCKDHGGDAGEISPTLRSMGHDGSHANGGGQVAVAFAQNTRDEVREMEVVGALAAEPGMKQTSCIRQSMAVRRLMPLECARLQGFPDDHCDIQPKGKPTPDGPQYKCYGNSMAVPVMRWIGLRVQTALYQTEP